MVFLYVLCQASLCHGPGICIAPGLLLVTSQQFVAVRGSAGSNALLMSPLLHVYYATPFSLLWQSTQESERIRRKGLLWLTVLEILHFAHLLCLCQGSPRWLRECDGTHLLTLTGRWGESASPVPPSRHVPPTGSNPSRLHPPPASPGWDQAIRWTYEGVLTVTTEMLVFPLNCQPLTTQDHFKHKSCCCTQAA